MSKYTITIKNLIDNDFDFQMTSYPIFDEEYRETLNNNILNYYYEDEIGFETAPLFRKYLNSTLNRIMPKYNIMYQAQKDLASNLYNTINITEMTKTTNESNTSSNSNSTSNSTSTSQATQDAKNLYQDTPQGKITQSDINSQTWATNVTFDNSSNSGTASSENSVNDESSAQGNSTQDYIRTLVGTDRTPYIDQYQKIVQNLKNIDDLIIQELSDLFMQIY